MMDGGASVRSGRRERSRRAFRRVRSNERLYLEVLRQIEDRIIRGELRPGDMLPPERIMADQFGVSRTVIREAMKAMEMQGLLEIQHGRGVMVARPSPERLADSMIRYVRIQESPIWALWELRTILEAEIAGLAAERWEDEDMALMTEQLERMAGSIARPKEYVEHDLEFHRAIVRAAHNPLFPTVLEPFVALLQESRQIGASVPNAPARSIVIHRRLLDAIKSRDSEAARRAMRDHFTQVAEFLSEAQARGAGRK